MSFYYAYLNVAEELLKSYSPPQPFHLYLKKHFSAHKKHGSRDRKVIAALCYAYFRLGKNFAGFPIQKKLLLGLALSHPELLNDKWSSIWQSSFEELGVPFQSLSFNEKILQLKLKLGFNEELLFPAIERLSNLKEKSEFLYSHLKQPLVWLRARKNKKEKVEEILTQEGIAFFTHPQVKNAVGVAKINIEQVFGKNHHHWVEVQDASSQQTANYIGISPKQKVWDCCSGAGGKSLMLKDNTTDFELFCSDVRPQILNNLKERFKAAALPSPFCSVANVSEPIDTITFENKDERKAASDTFFDVIIADVPCSGSGTWARTPEQAFYFDKNQIAVFGKKQRDIVKNATKLLKQGGTLYYITCSVFIEENEKQLPYFESLGYEVDNSLLIKGYAHQADTMFIALLKKT